MLYACFFNCFLNVFLPKFQLKTKNFSYSSFSFLVQPFSVKYITFLRTRQCSLEQMWAKFVWLFLAIVTFYLNCLDGGVLAHVFSALATFPVCSVPSYWTNRTPSKPSSSTLLHSCRGCCLQGSPIALMALWVHWYFHHQPSSPFLLPQKAHRHLWLSLFLLMWM